MYTGKFALAPWKGQVSGTFKEKTVEVQGRYENYQSTLSASDAPQALSTLGPTVRTLVSGLQLAKTGAEATTAIGKAIGGVLTKQKDIFNSPEAQLKRLTPKFGRAGGGQFDVKLIFDRHGGKGLLSGSVKLTIIPMRMTVEDYVGPAANVGLTGSVSVGSSVEYAW